MPSFVMALMVLVPGPIGDRVVGQDSRDLPERPAAALREEIERALPEGRLQEISLEACLRQAFSHNLGLQAAGMGVEATDSTIDEALGGFDPSYYADLNGGQNITPSSSFITRGELSGQIEIFPFQSDFFSLKTGVRGLSPLGLQYDLAFSTERRYLSPSGFAGLNPEVNSSVTLNVTQPLLRGFGSTVNKNVLYQARNNSRLGRLQFEQQMLDLGYSVIQAYWEYRFAVDSSITAREAMEVAAELLEVNEKKRDAGLFTDTDVVRARDEVKRRQADLIQARAAIGDTHDALKRLIFAMDSAEDWVQGLIPKSEIEWVNTEPPTITTDRWEEVIRESLERRPDLAAKRIELKNRDLDLAVAQNDRLPSLNLIGSYGLASLGTNYGNSVDFIEEREFPSFAIGLSLEVPIGNRAAWARWRRASIEKLRAEVELRDLEAGVVEEVRRALRALESSRQRVVSSRESRLLASEVYRKEHRLLEAGEGTPYQAREAERDLFVARDSELRAYLDYQIACASLERARGALLERYGIELPQSREHQGDIEY